MQASQRHPACRMRIRVPVPELPDIRPGDPGMTLEQFPGGTAHLPTRRQAFAHATEEELANAIFAYGEERFSRRIARALRIAIG